MFLQVRTIMIVAVSFIDLRPEMGVLQPISAPVNSKSVSIYSQLFLPLLRLLLTVLSTAAKRHYDIIFQVPCYICIYDTGVFICI